ncbi:MAG: hypothetical protein ACI4WX_03650 [Aristaeellaceae bacterium]
MIKVEIAGDQINCKLKGHRDDIINELAYAAAEFHFEYFRRMDGFDPATDKQMMIDTSCEAFCKLMRKIMEQRYESHYPRKLGMS